MGTSFANTSQLPFDKLSLDSSFPALAQFEPFNLPASNQRSLGYPHPPGTVTPLALRPVKADATLKEAIETVKYLQTTGSLSEKLSHHGVLLFRGLPVKSASDLSEFAHSFGYKPHEIVGIVVNRPVLAPNVAPANEAPNDVLIYNHNESPQVPHAPEYIFFAAIKAPKSGGETPISSSLELFHRVNKAAPEFIEELAQKGIISKVEYRPQPSRIGGSTLRQAFGKNIVDGDDEATQKAKIEAEIARYGRGEFTTWEWGPDGLLTLTHRLPVIRTQPKTNLPILFTGLAAYYKANLHNVGPGRQQPVVQFFGDGTPIPEKYIKLIADITDEIRVLHKWQEGDVLVYDNRIAQHGREPWQGEQSDRVVLASLFDDVVPGRYGFGPWAEVTQILD